MHSPKNKNDKEWHCRPENSCKFAFCLPFLYIQRRIDSGCTGQHHGERHNLIARLQNLAKAKNVCVSFVGGDVHVAGVGRLYTQPKAHRLRHDHRFMPQVHTGPFHTPPPPPPTHPSLSPPAVMCMWPGWGGSTLNPRCIASDMTTASCLRSPPFKC